jgi:TrmH family RNA methyltransferase
MGKTKEWKDNICFVLVEPKEPGNIGASARAMKNMGFRNLRLVNPPQRMTEEGRWFARNAHDVMDSAEIYSAFEDSISDKSIIAGTTRRVGKSRGVIFPVEQGARRIFDIASRGNSVAILFGREARGLYNEEVEECGFMLTIPSSKIQPSLNLSHAVLITAYELSKAEFRASGSGGQSSGDSRPLPLHPATYPSSAALADHEDVRALYKRISRALELLEYIPKGDRNIEKKILANLKHFIGRAGLTEWELKMLYGLCWQVEKIIGRE